MAPCLLTLGLAEKKVERKEGERGGGREGSKGGRREEGRGKEEGGEESGKEKTLVFSGRLFWFSKLPISKAILSSAMVLIIIAAMWPSCFPGHLICHHVWERLNSTD